MASTRGSFNLWSGKKLKDKPIFITPKNKFQKLAKAQEVVIFVHGMRNSTVGAKMGTNALRLRLRKLGYKHPIIGFSYDSNIRGAHLEKNYHKVLKTATKIADENGEKLAGLINTIHKKNYHTIIRIVAHSLGCEVAKSACGRLGWNPIVSLHLFGSPLETKTIIDPFEFITAFNIINYYNPKDSVIIEGVERGELREPSCLYDIDIKNATTNITSKRLYAKDHRFKSQMHALRSFP